MTKTILFALTSRATLGDTGAPTGAYAPEFAHPAGVFRDAGYQIAFCSVNGGPVPLDGIKAEDTGTSDFLAEPWVRSALNTTPTAAALDPEDYAMIYFAGGHGTMWDFPRAPDLAALASRIHTNGGVIAAVCHGPAGLIGVRDTDNSLLIEGRQVSSFTNEEEEAVGRADIVPFLLESRLAELGAKHIKAEPFTEFAVADGRLVTGQNPASAVRVARLALEQLH